MKAGLNYAFASRLTGRLLVIYGLFILLCVPAGFLAQLLVSRSFGPLADRSPLAWIMVASGAALILLALGMSRDKALTSC